MDDRQEGGYHFLHTVFLQSEFSFGSAVNVIGCTSCDIYNKRNTNHAFQWEEETKKFGPINFHAKSFRKLQT